MYFNNPELNLYNEFVIFHLTPIIIKNLSLNQILTIISSVTARDQQFLKIKIILIMFFTLFLRYLIKNTYKQNIKQGAWLNSSLSLWSEYYLPIDS